MSKTTATTLSEENVSTIDDRRRFYAERLRAEIPANWVIHNIGDLCSIRTGKLDVNQADEEGEYPFFTCAEKIYRINTHAFDAEAVLVAGNGFFNVKYYKGKFNAYQRTYVLSDIKTDAKFLYYYIDYRLRDITGESRGSTISYIRLGDLRDYPVAVAPPDQQRSIVAEIEKQFSRLDEAVANLKRVKVNLRRYRAAVLTAAVEGKLTENWRKQHPNVEPASKLLERILSERRAKWKGKGKYKETAETETSNFTPLPEGWTWASLDQLSWDSSYGTSVKCSYNNSGPAVLRIPNIASGKLDLRDLKFAPESYEIERGDKLSVGDLLIIRTNGSRNLIGRSAVARQPLPSASAFASYLIRFRLIQQLETIKWLSTIWDAEIFRAWIEQRASTSAGQHNISMSVLARLPIPVPPLAEQELIVAEVERRLSVIEELEATVEANLTRADRLRQSILTQAFSGKLLLGDLQLHETAAIGS